MPGESINLLAFVITISILVSLLIIGYVILFLVKQNKPASTSSNANGVQGRTGPYGFQGRPNAGPQGTSARGAQGYEGPQGFQGFVGTVRGNTSSFSGPQQHRLDATDDNSTSFNATGVPFIDAKDFTVDWRKVARKDLTASLVTMSCSNVQVWPTINGLKLFSFNVTLRNEFRLLDATQRRILGFNGYGSFVIDSDDGTNYISLVEVQVISTVVLKLIFRLAPDAGFTSENPRPSIPAYTLQYSIVYTAVP